MELDLLIEKAKAELMGSKDSEPVKHSCKLQGHDDSQSSDASQALAGCGSRDIARFIDHTLLKPDATCEQIAKLCEEMCIRDRCIPPLTASFRLHPMKR